MDIDKAPPESVAGDHSHLTLYSLACSQVKAQSAYLEMGDAFTIDDTTSAIAPPPRYKFDDDGPATIDVTPL